MEYILTESGIKFGEESVFTEGRVLEIAREAKQLYEAKQYEEFMILTCDEMPKELSRDDALILIDTVITETGGTIFEVASWIEDYQIGDELY